MPSNLRGQDVEQRLFRAVTDRTGLVCARWLQANPSRSSGYDSHARSSSPTTGSQGDMPEWAHAGGMRVLVATRDFGPDSRVALGTAIELLPRTGHLVLWLAAADDGSCECRPNAARCLAGCSAQGECLEATAARALRGWCDPGQWAHGAGRSAAVLIDELGPAGRDGQGRIRPYTQIGRARSVRERA